MKLALLLVLVFACVPKIPERPQQQLPMRDLPGIEVVVQPADEVAWVVTATNRRESTIKLVWDESSFVDYKGRSYGRLLRGRTHVFDENKPQMTSVIVPRSSVAEWCIPESSPAITNGPTNVANPDVVLPAAITKGVGRMIITFETENGKEQWEGALSFDGSRAPTVPHAMPVVETPPAP